jgi:hypothetical protein
LLGKCYTTWAKPLSLHKLFFLPHLQPPSSFIAEESWTGKKPYLVIAILPASSQSVMYLYWSLLYFSIPEIILVFLPPPCLVECEHLSVGALSCLQYSSTLNIPVVRLVLNTCLLINVSDIAGFGILGLWITNDQVSELSGVGISYWWLLEDQCQVVCCLSSNEVCSIVL